MHDGLQILRVALDDPGGLSGRTGSDRGLGRRPKVVDLVEVGARGALGIGIDNTSAGSLCAGADSQVFLGLRDNLAFEQLDELRLLGRGRVLYVVGDEDGAEARDRQRPRVKALLEVIDIFAVGHVGFGAGEQRRWDCG